MTPQSTAEFPDVDLVSGLQAGNLDTYEMLFKTHYPALCSYAYTYIQDREEAEEIVQNVFVAVWEKREALEIHTGLKPYLYAMVRNASLNLIKHTKVKQEHARQVMLEPEPVTYASGQVMAQELEQRIQQAIEKLPEQCRLIFKLSRFEELKYAEIADQLQLSVKTVENQMGKALRILREELKDYLPGLLFMLYWSLSQ